MTKLWFDYMAHSLLILISNGYSVMILNVLGVWPPCGSELCGLIWHFSDRASQYRLVSNYQLNAQFLYSITIYMLHYNPQHVSSSTMLIFRTNCIITASRIVTLCNRLYSLLSTGILYGCLQRVMIPDAVIIQFVLLKMSIVLLETCRGL